MKIVNDLHLGVNRSGGTTPVSYAELIEYTHSQFEALLETTDEPLLINGDLFDGFQVSNSVLLRTYTALNGWLERSGQPLYLSRGNHDISKDSSKLSSFDLLGGLLTSTSSKVRVVTAPTRITWEGGAGWVIPHAPNQDTFDVWLSNAVEHREGAEFLFVHANYNNGFAVESDHSLNISADVCRHLHSSGFRHIVFGHEHQQGERKDGVIIVGNQFPTSISDCLGNVNKRLLRIDGGIPRSEQTWEQQGNYMECPWDAITRVQPHTKFLRITGQAASEQASAVLDVLSALRKTHPAFVISNAVTIDGQALDVSSLETIEQVQAFNVLEFLFENFTPVQVEKLKQLHAMRPVSEKE